MKTSTKIWGVTLLLLITGAISLAIYVHNQGFSAREQPSWMEKMMAQNVRRIATPAGATELKNPFPPTETNLAEAREHFVAHCSICHGIDGRGDSTIGRNLYPKAPNMTGEDTQELTDGELFYIISNGIRFTGMPAWGSEDSPESIWALVAFIRRLPKLSSEELKQMREISGSDKDELAKPAKQKRTVQPKPHSHDAGAKPHQH